MDAANTDGITMGIKLTSQLWEVFLCNMLLIIFGSVTHEDYNSIFLCAICTICCFFAINYILSLLAYRPPGDGEGGA